MRLAHLTDIHLRQAQPGTSATNNRRSRDMARLLPEALEAIRKQDVDLLVVTGDLLDAPTWLWEPSWGFEIDDPASWLAAIEADYQLVRKLLDDSRLPYMVLPGNHDHEATFWQVFDSADNVRDVAGHRVVRFCDWETAGHFPRRFAQQRVRFNDMLADTAGPPQVHLQHYVVHPTLNEGYPHAYLEGEELARRTWTAGHVRLSLSGHYHKGTDLHRIGPCTFATTPAFCVRPFSWRVYEIQGEDVTMTAHALDPASSPRPVVFLDRDGVINDLASYRTGPELMRLIPGSGSAIAKLNAAGFAVVGITSQSCIGMGYVPESTVICVNDKMHRLLAEHGAHLDALYYSTGAGTEAILPAYEDISQCKPQPHHLQEAGKLLGLDFEGSWMVGDRHSDICTARNAGVQPLLVRTGQGEATEADHAADLAGVPVADDLAAAARIILAGR